MTRLQVVRFSEEYQQVKSRFNETMWGCSLRSIYRIENRELWEEFVGYAKRAQFTVRYGCNYSCY